MGKIVEWQDPPRKNSGLEQTAIFTSGRSSRNRRLISRLVPTGTVDFVAMMEEPIEVWRHFAQRLENGEIGKPSPRRIGVPTAKKTTSASCTAFGRKLENRLRPVGNIASYELTQT